MFRNKNRQNPDLFTIVTTEVVADSRHGVSAISNQHKIVYLACPYTHQDYAVREERFRLATKTAAELIRKGHIVYSPITMTHPIDVVMAGDTNTLGSDYWVQFDEAFMSVCAEMIVLQIEGWNQSRGIRREIDYFRSRGKPVRFLSVEQVLHPLDLETVY
jgi:hypothetical protein